ncbi:MAG: hypothetical protein M1825_005986 [Sarcosagium campestre]|nr:MAG: hypothetical protein M1825_005986 [Sarcosagium campestre]
MDGSLLEKVQSLSDLELAALLSLIAGQHCIIETDSESIDPLADELNLIATKIFSLSCKTIECSGTSTIDDFGNTLLQDNNSLEAVRDPKARSITLSERSSTQNFPRDDPKADPTIANVVIAKNLDCASRPMQIQALELLRTKRIYTHVAVHTAPKRFLFVILLVDNQRGNALVSHLSDQVLLSHYHSAEDGFINIEEGVEEAISERDSMSSVVRRPSKLPQVDEPETEPLKLSAEEIDLLTTQARSVTTTAEVRQYMQSINVFLRMHRAVGGGVTPQGTKHFELLAKCIAPLHGLSFVTPSLVGLAARKAYRHRIRIAAPEDERSIQWGSDLGTVADMLEGVTPVDVIEDVLSAVEMPL